MATEEEKPSQPAEAEDDSVSSEGDEGTAKSASSEAKAVSFEGSAPAQLGTARYVHAAFFAGGLGVAFLAGKVLATIWNLLAEWPRAVRAVPQLLQYAEDERPTYTMLVGALVGIFLVARYARRPDVRTWADEVVTELYKVHWPDREVVTNGTIVVLVAGLFATIYVGLLDRLWGFVTNLVYGA